MATELKDELSKLSNDVTVLDIVPVLGADGKPNGTTKVELSKKVSIPEKADSPKRAHTFYDIEGFCAYLKKYGSKDVVVLADTQNDVITATLNEVNAKGGFEIIELKLLADALFEPWQKKLDVENPRAEPIIPFCDWLRRNRAPIVEPDSRELVADLAQIRLSVGSEIDIGKGANALNGVRIKTVIQKQEKSELVTLPESFVLRLKAFEESKVTSDLPVELILSPAPGNTGVQVELVCPALPGFVRDQMKAVVDDVKTRLNGQEGIVFALGAPHTEEWTRNAK